MHVRGIGSLLLLVSLIGLQLELSLAAQTGPRLPDLNDPDDEFYDASERHQDALWAEEKLQDDYDEEEDDIFYEVENEMSFDETEAENTCATSNKEVCQRCCKNQGFDLPFWNKAIGQCQCFVSYGEENICKHAAQSSHTCMECCLDKGFSLSDYPSGGYGHQCYCSAPDFTLFEASFRRRVPK